MDARMAFAFTYAMTHQHGNIAANANAAYAQHNHIARASAKHPNVNDGKKIDHPRTSAT
jgi:hypothetical protein